MKVTVIIPSYNAGEFIREAIDSVLNQTFKDFEIIIIDDGSTDNTKEVVAKYGQKIRYIYQMNRGVSAARNRGILCSNGEYIAFLDADCAWFREKLELQVKYLDEHPEIGLVFSNALFQVKKGAPISDLVLHGRTTFQVSPPHRGKVFKDLFEADFIKLTTVLLRKALFQTVGLFDENINYAEDYHLKMRISRSFRIDYIDKSLTQINILGNSLSHNWGEMIKGNIAAKEDILRSDPQIVTKTDHNTLDRNYYRLYYALAAFNLEFGDKNQARLNAGKYLRFNRTRIRVYALLLATYLPPKISPIVGKYYRKFAIRVNARARSTTINQFSE